MLKKIYLIFCGIKRVCILDIFVDYLVRSLFSDKRLYGCLNEWARLP